jgi:aspartyl-tRNA(Asn)/glutamyl-tRNA(Gln) amidotransferase subunit C
MNTTKINKEDVQNIAAIYKMGLTPESAEQLSSDLSNILDQFKILENIDTSDVIPTGHSTSAEGTMRDDEPAQPLPVEKILDNAPSKEKGYFKVKVVLQ